MTRIRNIRDAERHFPAGRAASGMLPNLHLPHSPLLASIHLLSLVLALVALVHEPAAAGKSSAAEGGTPTAAAAANPPRKKAETPARIAANDLPRPTAEMVDAILTAVQSGSIEDLRTAIEWNELRPVFAPDRPEGDGDPIAFLKQASRDGEGAEMLAILGNFLAAGASLQPLGRDFENNAVYVWPYLAELAPAELTPSQMVELYRIVPAEEIAAMRKAGRWTWYRLVIGADGTWHSFMPHR